MSESSDNPQNDAIDGEVLAKKIQDVAKDVPPDEAKRIARVVTTYVREESWEGPLPPPHIFKQYPKEVQKAIVGQASAQMKHRHKIESKVVASGVKASEKGMTLAFWITVAMIVAGTVLVALNHSTAGLVAIFGPSGFQGGNYLFQKWREIHRASQSAKKQNDRHMDEAKDQEKIVQETAQG